MSKRTAPLPEGSVLGGQAAADISRRVEALNKDLSALAQQHGALVFDLGALFEQVRQQGVTIGNRRLTADFLGGFYSINGYYPGKIGQALITNGLIDLVNRTFATRYQPLEIGPMMLMTDAVLAYKGADGPMHGTLAGAFAAAGAGRQARRRRWRSSSTGMVRGKMNRKEEAAAAGERMRIRSVGRSNCRRASSRRCRSPASRVTTGTRCARRTPPKRSRRSTD